MNFQQLEYIVALDNYGNFSQAAKSCFVTQPTLSMMISKLEEELGLQLFERNKKPVTATREGKEIIIRARQILAETNRLREFATELKESLAGELHLGIIPTLAPYLLPLFLKSFSEKFPQIQLHIKELVTEEIIRRLKSAELDLALLATPLNETHLREIPLFYEEFFVYASQNQQFPTKKYLLPNHIDTTKLWLLEEGHCLRSQIFNLCELKKKEVGAQNVLYEAGSIETLINLVDHHEGITIVPELATRHLRPDQLKKIREFNPPKPVREISLVVAQNFPRLHILEKLKEEILKNLPEQQVQPTSNRVVKIS